MEPEVLEIRRLVADGASAGDLAARFGVGTANIMAIARRRTWKHLPLRVPPPGLVGPVTD
jgi:hypothetical protein